MYRKLKKALAILNDRKSREGIKGKESKKAKANAKAKADYVNIITYNKKNIYL